MQKGSELYPVITARWQNVNSKFQYYPKPTLFYYIVRCPQISSDWKQLPTVSPPQARAISTQFLISISQEACIKQCSWLHNGPQRYQILILWACKCYLVWRKGLCRCDLVKDLETGRLLWIIRGGYKQNVFIREWQREFKHRWGKGNRDPETGGRDWLEWCSHKAGNVHSHQMLEGGDKKELH